MMGVAIGRSLTTGWSGSNWGNGSPSLAMARDAASLHINVAPTSPAPAVSCDDDGVAVSSPQCDGEWGPGGRSSPVVFPAAFPRWAWPSRSCDPRDRLRWCDVDRET